MTETAQLGRAERWLRLIGLAIWLYVGFARRDFSGPWIAPWATYGVAYLGAFLWRSPLVLVLQAAGALAMSALGYPGFEGLLLSVVIAQAPTVLSLRGSAILAAALTVPLLAVVWAIRAAQDLFQIEGAYLAFSAFALLAYYLQAKERRARESLAAANAELLGTRGLLVDASRQAERLRISRELHDALGHHLTALSVQLQLASRAPAPAAADAVTRARAIAQDALGDVRRVVTEMQSPQALDLAASLSALASRIPAPRIHLDVPSDFAAPDAEASHALFRAVQEGITNCVKHAGASNVWVRVRQSGQTLEADVTDDGRGVDRIVPGRGLEGMRARLAAFGGEGTFRSEPGHGFALHVSLPLR